MVNKSLQKIVLATAGLASALGMAGCGREEVERPKLEDSNKYQSVLILNGDMPSGKLYAADLDGDNNVDAVVERPINIAHYYDATKKDSLKRYTQIIDDISVPLDQAEMISLNEYLNHARKVDFLLKNASYNFNKSLEDSR